MSNDLMVTTPTLPGIAPDAEIRAIRDQFVVSFVGTDLVTNRMPTRDERRKFLDHIERLGKDLEPIGGRHDTKVAARQPLSDLFMAYGFMRNMTDDQFAKEMAAYIHHLSEIPLFAIVAACADVKAGRVFDVDRRTGNRLPLDPDRPPSTIRLRQVAEKHVERMANEKWSFERILRAKRALDPPVSEQERKRVGDGLRSLASGLAKLSVEDRIEKERLIADKVKKQQDENDRRMLAQYEARGIRPVYVAGCLLSTHLSGKLGLHRSDKKQSAEKQTPAD